MSRDEENIIEPENSLKETPQENIDKPDEDVDKPDEDVDKPDEDEALPQLSSKPETKQEIYNEGEVKQQFNIDSVHGLYFNSRSNDDYSDPTDEFIASDSEVPSFKNQTELRDKFNILTKKRIILIDCLDDRVAESAIYCLVDICKGDYAPREILFEGKNKPRSDSLGLDIFEDTNKLKQINSGKQFAVVIRLNSNSQTFFESMRSSSRYAMKIKSILTEQEIFLICVIQSEFIRGLLHKPVKNEESENCFYHWNLDYLLPCLSEVYTQDEAVYLNKHIIEQKEIGLWGKISTSEFYRLIKHFISQKILKDEVEKRNNYGGEGITEFLNKINPLDIDQIFTEDIIERAVLYIAAFFPNLTPPDFDTLVCVLLKGRTITVYNNIKAFDSKKNKKLKLAEEKVLVDIWRESADSILSKCKLKTVTTKGSGRYIEFSNPYLRQALKLHLE